MSGNHIISSRENLEKRIDTSSTLPEKIGGFEDLKSVTNLIKQLDMEAIMFFDEARVYVGTYAKYNEGSLQGEWLNMKDYTTTAEFYEACRELHNDEVDPEFMFQDFEYIPEGFIGESWLHEYYFDLREALKDLSEDLIEPFFIWLRNDFSYNKTLSVEELMKNFSDQYCGMYATEEEFAREYVEQCHELPAFALTYFDYGAYSRDLFLSDYWFEDGYVFYK